MRFFIHLHPGTISSLFSYTLLLCFIAFVMTNIENTPANMINNLDGGVPSLPGIFENLDIPNANL